MGKMGKMGTWETWERWERWETWETWEFGKLSHSYGLRVGNLGIWELVKKGAKMAVDLKSCGASCRKGNNAHNAHNGNNAHNR